ncbi:MAG: ATP-binding protein [Symploca sp. SIO3E6]|nr:ATP-binding protein [Caldora sp. SIO3E6]
MPKTSTGAKPKKRALRLLEALLGFVNYELEEYEYLEKSITYRWESEHSTSPKLIVETKLRFLAELIQKDNYPGELTKEQIRQALNLMKDFLGILEDNRLQQRGSDTWNFTLALWSKDKTTNLERFDQEWESKRPEKSRQVQPNYQQAQPTYPNKIPPAVGKPVFMANRTQELQLLEQMVQQETPKILLIQAPPGFGRRKLWKKFVEKSSSVPNLHCIPISLQVAARKGRRHLLDSVSLRLGNQYFPNLETTEKNYWQKQEELLKYMPEQIDLEDDRNNPFRRLLSHLWAEVTQAFFTDLRHLNQQVVIFLDEYESATNELQNWIRGDFLLGAIATPRLAVIIAGDSVPEATIEWDDYCDNLDLQEIWDVEAWYQYCQERGWQRLSRKEVEEAVNANKGHPANVAKSLKLLAETRQENYEK